MALNQELKPEGWEITARDFSGQIEALDARSRNRRSLPSGKRQFLPRKRKEEATGRNVVQVSCTHFGETVSFRSHLIQSLDSFQFGAPDFGVWRLVQVQLPGVQQHTGPSGEARRNL